MVRLNIIIVNIALIARYLNETKLPGDVAGFDAVGDVELAIDALKLCTDGVDGDDKLAGDIGVAVARGQQAQDALFLWAERFEQE